MPRDRGSKIGRRTFLGGLVGSGALIAGCDDDASFLAPNLGEVCDAGSLGGGVRVPFVDETESGSLDVAFGEGLDGRLYTDLAKLEAGQLTVSNERFYIRTRVPDRIDYAAPWKIRGLDREISIDEIVAQSRAMPATLLECSGNAVGASFGLMSSARWSGVPLVELVPEATRILVAGFDDHSKASERSIAGASWIFSRQDLASTGAFLATQMNGQPLPVDHGFPVRLVVPGWYGCTCIKWVDTVRIVGEDEPSTEHMREFASRTHQAGEPALARDFKPAIIDLAAMPTRIERIQANGNDALRIDGIYWGGVELDAELQINIGSLTKRVEICTPRASATTWGLWSTRIELPPPGTHVIVLRSLRANVPTKRLDAAYYARTFTI